MLYSSCYYAPSPCPYFSKSLHSLLTLFVFQWSFFSSCFFILCSCFLPFLFIFSDYLPYFSLLPLASSIFLSSLFHSLFFPLSAPNLSHTRCFPRDISHYLPSPHLFPVALVEPSLIFFLYFSEVAFIFMKVELLGDVSTNTNGHRNLSSTLWI